MERLIGGYDHVALTGKAGGVTVRCWPDRAQ